MRGISTPFVVDDTSSMADGLAVAPVVLNEKPWPQAVAASFMMTHTHIVVLNSSRNFVAEILSIGFQFTYFSLLSD
jgi:hypothetical protein